MAHIEFPMIDQCACDTPETQSVTRPAVLVQVQPAGSHPGAHDRVSMVLSDTSGPKDRIHIRLLHPGSEAQQNRDSRNLGLKDPLVYVVFWTPRYRNKRSAFEAGYIPLMVQTLLTLMMLLYEVAA